MSKGSREGLTRLWPIYGLPQQDEPLDFAAITPVHDASVPTEVILEVGFGMGHVHDLLTAHDLARAVQQHLQQCAFRLGQTHLLALRADEAARAQA